MSNGDYAPILCKCGKVWTASERDAKEQCELEDRMRNKKTNWNKIRLYECPKDKGVWHWTRKVWLTKEELEEKKRKQSQVTCKCGNRYNPAFTSYDKVVEFVKTAKRPGNLEIRHYRCHRESVYHIEYFIPGITGIVCSHCHKLSYNRGNKTHRPVMEALRAMGNDQVNTSICKTGAFHLTCTVKKGK